MNRLLTSILSFFVLGATAQNIGDFVSIKPLGFQPDSLILPATHTFQYLIKTPHFYNYHGKL